MSIISLALTLLLFPSFAIAVVIEGTVVKVADGDTITVLVSDNVQHRVRIAGIDAPEKGQPFGNASRKRLTLDVGLAQITMGMAWWYRKYAHEQSAEDQGRYEFAEQEARTKKVGLWQDKNPQPPWEFRKAKRYEGRN
jgi:endonuclease YncB( thermonuclease family)